MNIMFSNVEFFDNHNLYLYHFTSLDTAFNHILKNNRLMFNAFSRVNDPKENKDWSITLSGQPTVDVYQLRKELNKRKNNSKVLCMTKDVDHQCSDYEKPFWRGWGHSAMWAHYADNHKGVCLIFDKTVLNKAITNQVGDKRLIMGCVDYSNKLQKLGNAFTFDFTQIASTSITDIVQTHFDAYFREIFFLKNEDWSHQCEWRYIYWSDVETQEYIDYEDSLKGIIFGSDCHYESCDRIAQGRGLRTGIMCWDQGWPGVSEFYAPR